ncbi:cellulose synthase-like protein G3 [Cucurbita pepo subsp. pepo]|uniref:cellulose synthase-like protein G3 n=1 Tax=Cucurbita pepo subsp. pepo TaxID=3664 RepID=UPI000C9DA2C0|nr:cellulose synthase-like protein G3 [Cucurbita pepo subsp. pepo]
MLLHFTAVLFLLYNRITAAFHRNDVVFPLLWALVTIAELIFTFVWVLTQSFRWRPVSRSVSPENLPGDEELPGVNVFIPTVDPAKEPTVEVMNTVLSSLALEYPAEKVGIYLSDDGGSPVTLYALKETFLQYQKESRSAFKTKWRGMDGVRGPVLSGTGYFLRRKTLNAKSSWSIPKVH